MGVVEQDAICVFIHLRERYFFVFQVGLVLEIETDGKTDWNFFFFLFLYSVRLYNANLLTHQTHH